MSADQYITAESSVPPEEIAQEEEEEDIGYKVFVGNLSFQTTEEELASFFSPAGKVLKANIITRGTRSLGYGFVAYDTFAESERATIELDKKELGGREINVEVAKPKADGEAARNRAAKGEAGRGRGIRRGRGRGRGNGSRNRSGWTGLRRFNRRRESDVEGAEEGAESAAASAFAGDGSNGGEGEPRDADDLGEPKEPKKRTRAKRVRGGVRVRGRNGKNGSGKDVVDGEQTEAGEPSKTTVFVANLPFATDDDALVALFKDFKIKSAHVVKRRSGRSKGFGFVDLVDEDEQKRVLEGMKGVKADDRELIIKVALSEPHVQDKDAGAAADADADADPNPIKSLDFPTE